MLHYVLKGLMAWLAAEQAANPDLPDLAELGLQDPSVARRLRDSGVMLEPLVAAELAEAGSSTPEGLTVPLRLLLPLAPAADSGWLEQAWRLLRAHGLQLELAPPATGTDPNARRAALAACDLVVLPCWQEGSLAALVEAAAMARPIICSDNPETRVLIRHGRDGLLVPAGNAQALQLAVQLLVRQPSFMQELGNCARHKVVTAYQIAEELDRSKSIVWCCRWWAECVVSQASGDPLRLLQKSLRLRAAPWQLPSPTAGRMMPACGASPRPAWSWRTGVWRSSISRPPAISRWPAPAGAM